MTAREFKNELKAFVAQIESMPDDWELEPNDLGNLKVFNKGVYIGYIGLRRANFDVAIGEQA